MAFCESLYSSPKPKGRKVSFEPVTIGDHIRKKRLEQGLWQENVAEIIGVSNDCVTNWEMNRTIPQIRFMPAIIQFLGFLPIEIDSSSLGGQILLFRHQHGLSQKVLGKIIGMDASTVRSWEMESSIPYGRNLEKLNDLLLHGV